MAKHALLSASGAHRWLLCTPSAQLEQKFPASTSAYAEEGTVAHALAELTTRYFLGELDEVAYYWNNLYRKRGDTARYRLDIPDAWALEIIPYAELSMLKSISKEG